MLNQESAGNLVKLLHLSITYLRIYPPTSPMVADTVDAFFKYLQAELKVSKSVSFSELSGKLIINGIESDNKEIQMISNMILKLFAQRKFQSITFHRELIKEELTDFLTNILRKRRHEMPGYTNIALDQTVYVALVKGEEAIVKISETIQNSGGEILGLIKSIRESYDLIDQLPDQGVKEQAQDHLAQELSKQNPAVLREIFDRELPLKIEESGLKKRLLSTLSQDKIQEIFGEISSWYAAIREKETSDFAAVDQLDKLQKFMKTILQAPAAKEIPRQFFEELIRKGLLEQLPDWFSTTPSKPTTVYEVEKLVEKSASDLLEKEVRDALPQMVEKLCQIENNELIGKLLEKILENLKNSAPKIRLLAIQSMAAIYEVLQAHNKEQLLRYIELPLLETARQETSVEVHYYMLEILRMRARQNLLHGEYDFAIRIIDLMRQHVSPEIVSDQKILANAVKSMDRLVPEIFDVLVSDLKSDNEIKRLGSLQILTKFGEKAVDPLIRVIKESQEIRSLKLAASVLRAIGDKAKLRFYDELNLGLTAAEIKNFISVLQDLGPVENVEQLSALLNFPDIEVKKDIMRFLAKLNINQSKILLIEQLKSRDTQIINEGVLLLGELRCKEAVPALVKLLHSRWLPTTIQEDICIALGSIADYKASEPLIQKVKKKPSIFSDNKTGIERVRMRAAWALRKFSGTSVESALESASKEKIAPVALTAKESLAIIRQGKMQK
ncbi:MAG: hypothetical protein ABII64_07410 [Elusimicrobiota bacterium]